MTLLAYKSVIVLNFCRSFQALVKINCMRVFLVVCSDEVKCFLFFSFNFFFSIVVDFSNSCNRSLIVEASTKATSHSTDIMEPTRSDIEEKHSSTERPEPQHSTSGDTVEISEQITQLTTAVYETTEENKENNHISNTDEVEGKDQTKTITGSTDVMESTRSNIEEKHLSSESPDPQQSTSGDTVELSKQVTPLTTAVYETTEENKENNHVSNTDEAERRDQTKTITGSTDVMESTRSNIEEKHLSTGSPEPQHSTRGDTVEILSEQITPLTTAVYETTEENKENNHISNTDNVERKDQKTDKKMKLKFSIINLDYNEELADEKSERYIKMTESLRRKVSTTKVSFPQGIYENGRICEGKNVS